MSKVSVLIPSFNHADFLPACLDSLEAQTFRDWSSVVVDDCSSDSSLAVLRGRASQTLQVESNEANLGTYGTLAQALDLADSAYVAVLNSDDVWAPTKLERQIAALDAHPEASFCFTLGAKIDGAGVRSREDVHEAWPTTEVQEPLPFLLTENRILASSVVFRRDSAVFRPELRYSGDWVALLDACLCGPAVCVPEALTLWRIHDRNTFRRSSAQVAEEIAVRQSILGAAETWPVRSIPTDAIARGLGACAMHLSALLVLQGRLKEARVAARIAARKAPGKASLRRLIAVCLPASMAHKRLWSAEERLAPTANSPLVEFGHH